MAERARLESVCTAKLYRGFESLSLRIDPSAQKKAKVSQRSLLINRLQIKYFCFLLALAV